MLILLKATFLRFQSIFCVQNFIICTALYIGNIVWLLLLYFIQTNVLQLSPALLKPSNHDLEPDRLLEPEDSRQ